MDNGLVTYLAGWPGCMGEQQMQGICDQSSHEFAVIT